MRNIITREFRGQFPSLILLISEIWAVYVSKYVSKYVCECVHIQSPDNTDHYGKLVVFIVPTGSSIIYLDLIDWIKLIFDC